VVAVVLVVVVATTVVVVALTPTGQVQSRARTMTILSRRVRIR
jgi:hypothetical protein